MKNQIDNGLGILPEDWAISLRDRGGVIGATETEIRKWILPFKFVLCITWKGCKFKVLQ